MSKVITFSRVFPAYHPKAGRPTYFIEKIWRGLYIPMPEWIEFLDKLNPEKPVESLQVALNCHHPVSFEPKHHTIRAGNRFKVGDKFSPRVWSGKPYQSKQIIIAPDIEVKKIWKFEADINRVFSLNGKYVDATSSICDGRTISEKDGLSEDDFLEWFPLGKAFSGQIICWNESINY